MITQLAGAVGPILRLPLSVVQGVEPLLEQLGTVAKRALALLDDVEQLPDRIRTVLGHADELSSDIAAVIGRAEATVAQATETLASIEPAVQVLAAIDLHVLQMLAPVIADLGALLAGARELDPALVGEAISVLRAVPELRSAVEQQLLPALTSLEGLVPVVAQLGVQVDHLDGTVEGLLAGIPGAARLLKRGATPRQVPPAAGT